MRQKNYSWRREKALTRACAGKRMKTGVSYSIIVCEQNNRVYPSHPATTRCRKIPKKTQKYLKRNKSFLLRYTFEATLCTRFQEIPFWDSPYASNKKGPKFEKLWATAF